MNGRCKEWYFNGQLHRINGPAFIRTDWIDINKWYYYGQIHRINGPAVIINDCKEWYFNGKMVQEKEYQEIMFYYNLYQLIIKEINFN